jgi:hypothetical protein
MKKKKTPKTESRIKANKYAKEIESWGILTLMARMRDEYVRQMERERATIFSYQTQPYDDSPLSNLDHIRHAFEKKFAQEFGKIYKALEDMKLKEEMDGIFQNKNC